MSLLDMRDENLIGLETKAREKIGVFCRKGDRSFRESGAHIRPDERGSHDLIEE